ncbi:MAG: DUF1295 domain-containing protein [Gemmatimonadota bacterium]|nr:DUF1295 domain-containing protein [Gemmatimonadota bacterium]
MSAVAALALVAVVMSAVMVGLWLVQRRILEADVVDLGWTIGLGGAAVLYALVLPDGVEWRRWMIAGMAGIWSARLASYLLFKRVLVKGEDGRYQDLRRKWGGDAQRKLFVFFQAQAVLVVILSVHFILAMQADDPGFRALDIIGVVLWLVSIVGESIADRQLSRFLADPANSGAVCQAGLWKYSRHPNFFFEWFHWVAYVPIAFGSVPFWATLVAPVLMFVAIVFVTGIPPIEERSVRRRGDAYREYQRTTSVLIPWLRRKA